MKSNVFVVFFLYFLPVSLYSQIGGQSTYQFLSLPNAARVAALGGDVVSIKDNDLNLAFHNPALLDSTLHQHFVMNYVNYLADVNFGYISYAQHFKGLGTFAAGIHYINYGQFDETNEVGDIIGEFKAAEYAFNIMYTKPINEYFRFGAAIKPVLSNLERYTSFGMVADLGVSYVSPDTLFSAGFVLKNIGAQIKPYYPGNYEPVPFDIQIGVTKKLRHAPFRFTFLAHHLHIWDMTFEKPEEEDNFLDPFTNEPVKEKKFNQFADNLMRHCNFGVEILLTENFHIDFSYNHLRRKELSISTRPHMVGFSWGFGFKISKFHISYGRASYHLATASNHFSLSTNFGEFYRKNK